MNFRKFSLFIGLIGITSTLVFSQPGGPPEEEEGIPIDGGITLLVGTGILYGMRELRKRRN